MRNPEICVWLYVDGVAFFLNYCTKDRYVVDVGGATEIIIFPGVYNYSKNNILTKKVHV